MKTAEAKSAAEQGIAEEDARKQGLEAKSKEFAEKGADCAFTNAAALCGWARRWLRCGSRR
jgi:hypothetical protein